MKNYILRKYVNDDYEFVYEVKKNAYKKYVEKCWGKWDEISDTHHLTEESFLVIDYQNKIDEEFMKDIKELKLLCEKFISDNKNIICIGD